MNWHLIVLRSELKDSHQIRSKFSISALSRTILLKSNVVDPLA